MTNDVFPPLDDLALLDLLLAEERAPAAAAAPAVARRSGNEPPRIAAAQQRLWFLHQALPRDPAYNIACGVRIEGALRVDALRDAVRALVRRHESLRCGFPAVDGRPQVTLLASEAADVELQLLDQEGATAEAVAARCTALAREPFDLAAPPLLRAWLLRLAPQAHVALFSMHHIVADGGSMGLLVEELGALYAAFAAGEPAPLPPPALQYGDFAAWQAHWLAGEEAAAQRQWWTEKLAGVTPLELPTDRARPAQPSHGGGTQAWQVGPETAAALRRLGQREGASPFMTLLAAFAVLLSRWSGQSDVVVGAPVANRNRRELEGLVGMLVNTLPLRCDLSGRPGFTEVLRRVRDFCGEALARQDLPLEEMVRAVAPQRDGSANPLFQVAFSMEGREVAPALALSGLALSRVDVEMGIAKFDLLLHAAESAQGLQGAFEYAADLFDAATVARMAGHFTVLLEAIAADPQADVATLPLLGAAERAELARWNDTTRPYPREDSLAQVFARQAQATPQAPALEFEDAQLGYAALQERATRLAWRLRQAGVRPGTPVALHARRSAAMVVGMLAILQAGGCYVPLDPSYPAERLEGMLQDCAAPVLLVSADLAGVLAARPGLEVIALEGLDALPLPPAEAALPGPGVDGGSPAYVIYTSGSTGKPKGVVVPQRAVARLVLNSDYVVFGPGDRVGQASNASFDAATFEVWGALLNGGCLVGVPQDVVLAPARLAALIRERRLTTLFLTTSLFHLIARESPGIFAPLRDLVVGGEAMDAQCTREVLQAGGPQRLVNGYGPTENTTFSAWHLVRELVAEAATVPIGRALANTVLHVLDAQGQLVPVGVHGELYMGGDGLALGYLGREDATAERFVPNPLDGGRTRLYRSGDIVRRLGDGQGTLEFIGRRDGQVKIRGFRVELGEIEAALMRQPAVREAAVLARQDRPGPRELVGYVAWRAGAAVPSIAALRQALGRELPPHMVPGRWVVLPALPINENGKLARQVLPAPQDDGVDLAAAEAGAAPQGEREACIAEVWRQVLGRAQVGRGQSWFELGGDSITAIQVVSRLRRAGWRVQVAELFRHPTIAALAPCLEAELPDVPEEEAVADGPLPLTPVQRWFFELHRQGRRDHFNQAVLLELGERFEAAALREALALLLSRHDALRLRFATQPDGAVLQTLLPPGEEPAFETLDLRGAADWEAALQAHADGVQARLDIERGPMLRAVQVRCDGGDRLLLVIHHLSVDAVSWRILLEDLELALRQAGAGRHADLGPASWSFGRWARRMEAFAQTPALLSEDAYWTAVEDAPAELLPLAGAAGAVCRHGDAQAVQQLLSAEDTARLLTRSHRLFDTGIMELLLVALGRALQRWAGVRATRITLEGHGREPQGGEDLTRTVGWFTSLYPFLLQLQGEDVGAQLAHVRDALRSVPRKGIGHGLLRHGARARAESRPQLSFNYLGQFGAGADGASAPALVRFGSGPTGCAIDPALPRAHALDLTALVSGGQLAMSLDFDPAVLAPPRAAALLELLAAELVAVGRHCHEQLERVDALQGASEGVEDAYPLSPLQEGMLFQSLLEPEAPVYQVQVRLRVRGALDLDAFRGAWSDLCRRHAVLRSAFVHEDLPRPMQLVLREREPVFHVGAADAIEAYCDADQRHGFALQRDALMRVAVFSEREDLHHVVWSYHHILLDGWCLAILQRDLAELYAARLGARAPQLPPVPPYRHYIDWIGRQDREAARRYWQALLAGYEHTTSLPRRPVREAGAARRTAEHTLALDAATTAGLAQLAAGAGVTLNAVVQTLWALLLARHADRDEVVFGTIVSGRPAELPGVEQMVGLFIGAVPVRVTLPPDEPFEAVARRVQERALASEPHRHLSLADIQAESPLGRSLFDHLVVFENYPLQAAGAEDGAAAAGPSLEVERAHDPTHYDLDLTVVPGACLAFIFAFDANVYPVAQIERVARQLRTAIDSVLAAPGRPIRALEILPAEERALVLEGFNATDAAYPPGVGFVELFEAQAARTPQAVALRCGELSLRYGELDRAANRLAQRLRRLGVGPEVTVGVCVERTAQMVIAPLAVFKAGGVFVPLDPEYPRQRLAFMAADAGLRVLLAPPAQGERFEGADEADALAWLDPQDPTLAAEPDTPPLPRPAPGHTAYLIYTSGSTGTPKGVSVSHANLANAVFAWRDAYRLGTFPVRLLQMASMSFDVFMGDLVRALAHGGTLVVCPADALLDPPALHALLMRHEITLFEATPAVVLPLMEHVHRQQLPLGALRLLIVGSDLLPTQHFRTLWERFGTRLRLLNSYGATEATIDSSFFEMSDARALEGVGANTPIGRPLGNTRCYVLDRLGRPQPIGAAGELCIGGAGVAQGYLNRPELTAERFGPCAAAGGVRAYRTGDLACWLPDGNLEFFGRRDAQVKVRGYRIELGEIEDRLLRCAGVRQAVVIARDLGQGPELLAYLVAQPGWELAHTREQLRQALPGYMVPSFFVRLEQLPLSPNGKVDRRALPDPQAVAERAGAYQAPEDALEQQIAAIWRQVLQVRTVGRRDDFFELGGHSLKAMQIVGQLHKALGVSVALRSFFEAPTVEAQARLVQQAQAAEHTALREIPPAPALPHYALSHAQRRLWMLDQLGGGAAYNMPEAHLIEAEIDAAALRQALAALVARHESLRTAFIRVDGEPRQQILPPMAVPLDEHDLRALAPAEAEARSRGVADRDANTAFDLGAPPLLRASLVRLPGARSLFVLTLHHIIGDGWSCNVVVRELLALYEALRQGRPDPLAPLRIQYKDFAYWQNARDFEAQERYWLDHLAGMPDGLALPYDFAATSERDFSGDIVQLTLEREVVAGLRRLALARRTTLSNVMLALLQLLLYHWTRHGDVCVGMSVANRSHPDIERLIGFFVNLLPIRCRLDDDMEFDDLLAQVIQRSGEALEHQDYPFDLLVEKLNPQRRANRQPLINVVYGFQNFTDVQVQDVPSLAEGAGVAAQDAPQEPAAGWSAFDFSFRTSKFDLTLFVVEEAGDVKLTMEYDSTLFLPATVRAQLDTLADFARAVAGITH